jgi:hypothetical protein
MILFGRTGNNSRTCLLGSVLMADFATLSEMLAAQSERKLQKLREGITAEITRLGAELRIVDDALARKQRREKTPAPIREQTPTVILAESVQRRRGSNGKAGLARTELLGYILAVDKPVTTAEVQTILAGKGIIRTVEAVRVAMSRLEGDGSLVRLPDGRFAAPSRDGGGDEVESGDPLWGVGLEMSEVATSGA